MTVLVDDLRYDSKTRKTWCHMASTLGSNAQGLAELNAVIDKIGGKRTWLQLRPKLWHYDLQPRLRRLAVRQCGALEVDGIELVKRCHDDWRRK